MKIAITIFSIFVIINCSYVRQSPSIVYRASMNDKSIFMESPMIVTADNKYFLSYRHAKHTNYFYTRSIITAKKLIFFLEVMTSTGDLSGRIFYEEIVNKDKIKLIKKNKVYWQEPDLSLVPLKINSMKIKPAEILKYDLKPKHY